MNKKQYSIYHARWQLSSILMMLPMYIFSTLLAFPLWMAFPIVHLIGACVFWYVDEWIFDRE